MGNKLKIKTLPTPVEGLYVTPVVTPEAVQGEGSFPELPDGSASGVEDLKTYLEKLENYLKDLKDAIDDRVVNIELPEWDSSNPTTTGVQTKNIADKAITDAKVMPYNSETDLGGLSGDKIKNNAITSEKIHNNTIQIEDLAFDPFPEAVLLGEVQDNLSSPTETNGTSGYSRKLSSKFSICGQDGKIDDSTKWTDFRCLVLGIGIIKSRSDNRSEKRLLQTTIVPVNWILNNLTLDTNESKIQSGYNHATITRLVDEELYAHLYTGTTSTDFSLQIQSEYQYSSGVSGNSHGYAVLWGIK